MPEPQEAADEVRKILDGKKMKHIWIDTRDINNCIYEKNAVVSEEMYTKEDWEALLAGNEVESDWDYAGNPTRWDSIHREEEDCNED